MRLEFHFRVTIALVLGVLIGGWPSATFAQDNDDDDGPAYAQASADELGLRIPAGEPKPGDDRRVLVRGTGEFGIVAKVHVEIADSFIVILPDGKLLSVKVEDAVLTEDEFVPVTQDEMMESLTEGDFETFRAKKTAHFIFVYNTSDEFQLATSRILESMYRPLYSYFSREKFDVHDPEAPLVVVMFRTRDEFDAYRHMPPAVAAYYDTVSNYVILHEQSELTEIAPELAVKQAISTIAHEGVHQILHNIGVQQRLSEWPAWISEGLPEFFAPTDTKRNVRWKGMFQVNDLRLHTLVKHFENVGAETGREDLIEPTIAAADLDLLGYAKSWALVHFLARTKRQQMFDYLREVSQLGPLEDPIDSPAVFQKHFGEETDRMSQQLAAHLNRMPYSDPWINQTHYLVTAETPTNRQTLVTPSPSKIYEWRDEMTQSYGAALRMNVQAFSNKTQAQQAAQVWLGN